MFREVDTQYDAAATLIRMFRDYLLSAGTEPATAERIIDGVLEEVHWESQDRFDADALNAKYGDVQAALENDGPADVEAETTFDSPGDRNGIRMRAASEYFRETLDYFPDDTPPNVFQGVMGTLLLELDAVHQEVEEIGPCGNETAASRQKDALHHCYHERLPYLGRKTLPYGFVGEDQTEEDEAGYINGGTADLPCTAEVLGDNIDGLAAALQATVKALIEDDGYGEATFEDLRQIGRWFHTTDIEQYAEEYGKQYEEALELLYGILELRRQSVIFGKTIRERRLDDALQFCYVAIVTQAYMKTEWPEAIIEPMKRQSEANDDVDRIDD